MNDSFVDLDLIGQVDPDSFKVTRPSFYAELIWNSRTERAKIDRQERRLGGPRGTASSTSICTICGASARPSTSLPRRVGFRVIPGLGERVIYRELFPKGLTLLDLAAIWARSGWGHITARQELREMISGLGVPDFRRGRGKRVAAAG